MDPAGKGYQVTFEDDYVLVRADPGQLLTEELLIRIVDEVHSHDVYQKETRAGLWDFRGCSATLDYAAVERVSARVKGWYDPSWTIRYTAMVADKDLVFGLARIYDALTENIPTNFRLFRDFEEARSWLKEMVG